MPTPKRQSVIFVCGGKLRKEGYYQHTDYYNKRQEYLSCERLGTYLKLKRL